MEEETGLANPKSMSQQKTNRVECGIFFPNNLKGWTFASLFVSVSLLFTAHVTVHSIHRTPGPSKNCYIFMVPPWQVHHGCCFTQIYKRPSVQSSQFPRCLGQSYTAVIQVTLFNVEQLDLHRLFTLIKQYVFTSIQISWAQMQVKCPGSNLEHCDLIWA